MPPARERRSHNIKTSHCGPSWCGQGSAWRDSRGSRVLLLLTGHCLGPHGPVRPGSGRIGVQASGLRAFEYFKSGCRGQFAFCVPTHPVGNCENWVLGKPKSLAFDKPNGPIMLQSHHWVQDTVHTEEDPQLAFDVRSLCR